MRLVFGRDAEVAHWVAIRIPHMAEPLLNSEFGQAFGPCAAIGIENEKGFLTAGVVYHNHAPWWRGIELSCASEGRRWLTPEILRALLRYPFQQLQCVRCTAVTPLRSDEPRRFLERLGFKREGVARHGFLSDHAVIYGLTVQDWAKHPLGSERKAPTGASSHGEEERPRPASRARSRRRKPGADAVQH